MPSHYYGGAPNAFAGGALFQKDFRRQEHQDNALNALIQRFGPEAGDPVAWGQAQAVDQNEQLFPHDLAAAERGTAAFDALAQEHGPIAGDPTAHSIDTVEDRNFQGAALGAARILQTTRDRGGDLGQAFDQIEGIFPHLGVPAEGVAAMRQDILANPQIVDGLIEMLRGLDRTRAGTGQVRGLSGGRAFRDPDTGEMVYGIPMSDGSVQVVRDERGRPMRPVTEELAEDRIGQRDRALSNEEARMRGFDATEGHQYYMTPEGEIYARVVEGTEQSRAVEDRERRISAEEQSRIEGAQEVAQRTELAMQSLDNTLEQLDRWGIVQGGEGNLARGVRAFQGLPGVRAMTDVGRYQEEVQTLLAHVAIDRLVSIKAEGATLGQITEKELQLLQDSMGNLRSTTRSPELLRQDLQNIRDVLRKMRANALEDLGEADPSGGGGGASSSSGASGSGSTTWQQRATELQSQGLSEAEIIQQLREEGLIASGGGR